jgi:hypothetical protein
LAPSLAADVPLGELERDRGEFLVVQLREVVDRRVTVSGHPVDDLGVQPDRPVHPGEPGFDDLP